MALTGVVENLKGVRSVDPPRVAHPVGGVAVLPGFAKDKSSVGLVVNGRLPKDTAERGLTSRLWPPKIRGGATA